MTDKLRGECFEIEYYDEITKTWHDRSHCLANNHMKRTEHKDAKLKWILEHREPH